MPAAFTRHAELKAFLTQQAEGGNKFAQALLDITSGSYHVVMTSAVKGTPTANAWRVTGQIYDQDGTAVAAARDVFLKSMPVTGAQGGIAGVTGTVKTGSTTKEMWIKTNASGTFVVDVTDTVAETCLLIATLDSGETRAIELT